MQVGGYIIYFTIVNIMRYRNEANKLPKNEDSINESALIIYTMHSYNKPGHEGAEKPIQCRVPNSILKVELIEEKNRGGNHVT